MEILLKDDILLLANLTVKKLLERKVKSLGDVYLTLGYQEIAQKVNLDANTVIEQYVAKLIKEKFLFAQINQETQTVEFKEDMSTIGLVETLEN